MADYQPQMGSEEAAAGVDLTGKTVVVTGGSAGLGVETIRVLAKLHHCAFMPQTTACWWTAEEGIDCKIVARNHFALSSM